MDALTKVYKINKLKEKIKRLERKINDFSFSAVEETGFLKNLFSLHKAKKLSKKYEKIILKLGKVFNQ